GYLRALAVALMTQPIARRRFAVIVAAAFVWSYALGVLTYVLLTPEIGLRCAFTPVVNHFDPDFLYPRDQTPLHAGDELVQLGDRDERSDWLELLRKLIDLNNEPAEEVTSLPADPPEDQVLAGGPTTILLDGQRLVRIRYHHLGESKKTHTIWL